MLGDELKNARIAAGLTQEELSFAAKIDRTYISMLENNKKSPTVDVLFRLCRAFGIKASELLARFEQFDKISPKKLPSRSKRA